MIFFLIFSLIFGPISAEEAFVETENASLYCQTFGTGKPLLVLHGGPGLSQNYLLPFMRELSRKHFLIFYDQRGCGNSVGSIDTDQITLEKYVEDIEAIRKHFGFEKISVLGHSWGGFLAMHYALHHSEHIEKLILSNTTPATSEGMKLFVDEVRKRLSPFGDEIERIHKEPTFSQGDSELIERLHRIIFRAYCFDPRKADELELKRSKEANVRGSVIYEIFREKVLLKNYNLLPSLAKLNLKTLIIHGSSDPIPCACALEIAECIPSSAFVVLQECGHFPYVESPEEYFLTIENFLNE